MTGALLILAATVLMGLILWLTHRPDPAPAEPGPSDAEAARPEGCCGLHDVCEKSLVDAANPEYYDDEHLDAYRGRAAADYGEAEIEEFRDVMLTLLPSDVPGWKASLESRGLELPACLRDELMIILADIAAKP